MATNSSKGVPGIDQEPLLGPVAPLLSVSEPISQYRSFTPLGRNMPIAALRVHDGSETPSTISLKQVSTIAEMRTPTVWFTLIDPRHGRRCLACTDHDGSAFGRWWQVRG